MLRRLLQPRTLLHFGRHPESTPAPYPYAGQPDWIQASPVRIRRALARARKAPSVGNARRAAWGSAVSLYVDRFIRINVAYLRGPLKFFALIEDKITARVWFRFIPARLYDSVMKNWIFHAEPQNRRQ